MKFSVLSISSWSVCLTVIFIINLCPAIVWLFGNKMFLGIQNSDHRQTILPSRQNSENDVAGDSKEALRILGKNLEKIHTGYGSNIFVSVKTSYRLYRRRLFYQMLTWFQTVDKNKLSIVSDDPNKALEEIAIIRKSGFHLLLSNCDSSHDMYSLCCKSAAEFSVYYKELDKHKNEQDKYQWYCHFDDDMYVNIPALGKLLQQYDPHQPYYIGRWPREAWKVPMSETYVGLNQTVIDNIISFNYTLKRHKYWYAAGCGYCLSHAIMMEARRILFGDINYCKVTLNPDDVSVGIVIGALLGYNLTDIDEIHSHRENMIHSSLEQTMSYVSVGSANKKSSLITPFSNDKHKFMAFHCLLYPSVSWCQDQKIVTRSTILLL